MKRPLNKRKVIINVRGFIVIVIRGTIIVTSINTAHRSKSLCLIFLPHFIFIYTFLLVCMILSLYLYNACMYIYIYIKMGDIILNRNKVDIHLRVKQLPFTFRVLLLFGYRYFYWRILRGGFNIWLKVAGLGSFASR